MSKRLKEICGYVEKWRGRMLLTNWDVSVVLSNSNKPQRPNTLADISARFRYNEATLTAYPWLWNFPESSIKTREATIVHELAHIYLNQLDGLYERVRDGSVVNTDQWNDALEQATELIAKALTR